MAVVDIRPPAPSTITIISLDTVGGTIGWRVGTDSHELRSVRATGASQVGILVVGNRNSINYNSVRSSAVGIEIDGDCNDLRGGTVENNTSRDQLRGQCLHQIAVWLDPVQLQRFEIDAKGQCLLLHEGDNAMKP